MKTWNGQVVLARAGEPDAQAALVSIPLPAGKAGGRIFPAGRVRAGLQPVAWRAGGAPRRALAALCVEPGGRLPARLKLNGRRPAGGGGEPARAWTIAVTPTLERPAYVPHRFADIDSLRGVPAADCTTMEYALDLSFGGRTLRLQPGATGPGQAECLWQNVLADRLWAHDGAEAVRVGGVIYNEDTYLWADLYLVLFANGVVDATLHFHNTRLHIKGYDFRGFPYLKIGGADLKPVDADLPADGMRQALGGASFNFADTAITCGPEFPALLRARGGAAYYTPFARIVNPQKPDSPDDLWEPGFARTVRFQFSLSDAPPAVARYTVPAWWYAVCGEPWPFGLLPVEGRYAPVAAGAAAHVRGLFRRGTFDGGSACGGSREPTQPAGNDGDTGAGLMQQAYLTGEHALYRDALDYCTYWADLAVDHTDFSVRQWVGGWGWKTCAYSKFRDVWFAYLETGDPWMRDTAEQAAATYWSWFRANWPRNTIGRDGFEAGAWALLARHGGLGHAADRAREFARMFRAVLEARGVIGGQMGVGPHPGFHSSLYMSGVVMISLMDILEMDLEAGVPADGHRPDLEALHRQYIRDDVELFPSNLGLVRAKWLDHTHMEWATFALRVYAEMGRLYGFDHPAVRAGFGKLQATLGYDQGAWSRSGRLGNRHVHPRYHDMLMLAARPAEDGLGVDLDPAFGLHTLPWPAAQVVATPWGPLTVRAVTEGDATALAFEADRDFRIRVRAGEGWLEARPGGGVLITEA